MNKPLLSDTEIPPLAFSYTDRPDESAKKLEEQVAGHFEKLRGSVYGYLMSVFGHPSDAEDDTQEAFLRLFRFLLSGGTVHDVKSWVMHVAHNSAIERYKKSASNHSLPALTSEEIQALVENRIDTGLDPEARVLLMERWKKLMVAWGGLSARQKQCLGLRVEGLRYREIAEILGVSITTVEDSLERSIKKLMREIHG
jgi:RNA polymerase sigma-70 factor (ECF subfamily)